MTIAEASAGAFLFGVANAAHCAGMCGLFAVQAGGVGRFALYALGKTFTYAALGTVAGSLGAGALRALGGAQAWLGLAAGVLVVVAGVRFLRPPGARPGGALSALVAPFAAGAARARSVGGPFLFGAATGLLPCGVVWLAAAQGAATASPAGGAAAMAAFGAGTIPVLAAVALFGRGALLRVGPSRVRTAGAVLVILCGIVTSVRASIPLLAETGGVPASCH